MSQAISLSDEQTSEYLVKLKRRAVQQEYKKGSSIFSEGDIADHIYFIETGRVSVFIQEFTRQEEVSVLGPGEHFGEMAFFSGDKRAASVVALEDTILLSIDRTEFLNLYETDRDFAGKINAILDKRNVELTSKETLIENVGISKKGFHIGIKGDPSLRESAFTREKYESVVDQYLP